jgi:hypothetical protein
MAEHALSGDRDRPAQRQPQPAKRVALGAPARSRAPSPTQALALQRAAGNRAATRVLSRWAAHPDPDKKGVLMADAVATEYSRFNPPLNN